YQRERRGIMLEYLALELVTLPQAVPFDADLAVNAVREAVALGGGAYAWSVLGVVLDRTGRHDEALQAFQTATTRPDWKRGSQFHWFGLARVRARAGDRAAARDCYERGLKARSDTGSHVGDFLRDEADRWINAAHDGG